MTPAAQYAAAIEVLDSILTGVPAEKSLTNWGRRNRFAGSKDRAAIRDHVFDILRAKRSLGILGGAQDGRGLVLGLLRRNGIAADTVFGIGGYAPPAITSAEANHTGNRDDMSQAEAWDMPDWLVPVWQDSLGDDAAEVARILQSRAGIFLRVNLCRATRQDAISILAKDGIGARTVPNVRTALQVTDNHRRISNSEAYLEGYVELQDTASQIAMLDAPVAQNARVLDFCAGGGGKALALADMYGAAVTAHDIAPQRLVDLPDRAKRAGVTIEQATNDALASVQPFDVVLCDAPCSGSGTWRRTPEAKWSLAPEKLHTYNALQSSVLADGSRYVAPGGCLIYATCSVLKQENDAVVDQFMTENTGWKNLKTLRLQPNSQHDGFFMVAMSSPNAR